MAMQVEAQPLIDHFELRLSGYLREPLPIQYFEGEIHGSQVVLVVSGKDPIFGVDCIGTLPAGLAADHIIARFKPELFVNAGTCGGFSSRGAKIGDIYLVDKTQFHDHRISLPRYDEFARAEISTTLPLERFLIDESKVGRLSTGDSLDMSYADAEIIEKFGTHVKDMEGAAIHWVCQLYKCPLLMIKSVTDIVDGPHPTEVEFLQNLKAASHSLQKYLGDLIETLTEEKH